MTHFYILKSIVLYTIRNECTEEYACNGNNYNYNEFPPMAKSFSEQNLCLLGL